MNRRLHTLSIFIIGLIAAATVSCDRAAETTVKPVSVTLAVVDLGGWYDGYDDPYSRDQQAQPTAPAELARGAALIREIDADVVAISGIENEGLLVEFNRRTLPVDPDPTVLVYADDRRTYRLDGPETQASLASQPNVLYPETSAAYPYSYADRSEGGAAQNIGLLTRLPIESMGSIPAPVVGDPGFTRPITHARLRVAPAALLHLLVYRHARDAEVGEAAAALTRAERMIEQNPRARVALALTGMTQAQAQGLSPTGMIMAAQTSGRGDIVAMLLLSPRLAEEMIQGSAVAVTTLSDDQPVRRPALTAGFLLHVEAPAPATSAVQ